MRKLVLLGVMLAAAVGNAEPIEILIDFGSGAPTPTLGGTWNSTTSGDTTLLTVLDTSGSVVPGVTLQTGTWTATDTMTDPSHTWTKEWVDAKALAALPAHAVLVNVARGSLLDEAALAEAMHRKAIAAAMEARPMAMIGQPATQVR